MRRITKPLAVVSAIIVVGLVVSACGGGSAVPGNSVASVAGNPITTKAWKHWMFVTEKQSSAQSGQPAIVPTDPPKFAGCIKQVHRLIPQLAKTSAATLRTDCQRLFTGLNQATLGRLIQSYWFQAYAHKLGYHVTNAQVTKALDKAKKTQFKTAKEYQTFLTESGQTNADIRWQVLTNELVTKLLKRKTKPINDAAIQQYYNQHKSQFGTPETRDLRIVRTHDQAHAQRALAALKGGQSFADVAKQYSVDSATNQTGGVLKGVTKGQEEHALDQVAFSSPVGKLQGPVHGTFGWYVVEVTAIHKATQQPLSQVKHTIRGLLKQTNSTAAQNAVSKAAQNAFGARTICRHAYAMADCHGFKPTPTTAATTPAGATTTPAAGATTTPAGATTTPAAGATTTPAGATTTPASGSTTPASGSNAPASGTTTPAAGATTSTTPGTTTH